MSSHATLLPKTRKVGFDACQDGGGFAGAVTGREPSPCLLLIFAVIAAVNAMTERHNVGGNCARAVWIRKWQPVIHRERMPKSWWASTYGALAVEVIYGCFPIAFGVGNRQRAPKRNSLLSFYLRAFRVLFLITTIAFASLIRVSLGVLGCALFAASAQPILISCRSSKEFGCGRFFFLASYAPLEALSCGSQVGHVGLVVALSANRVESVLLFREMSEIFGMRRLLFPATEAPLIAVTGRKSIPEAFFGRSTLLARNSQAVSLLIGAMKISESGRKPSLAAIALFGWNWIWGIIKGHQNLPFWCLIRGRVNGTLPGITIGFAPVIILKTGVFA